MFIISETFQFFSHPSSLNKRNSYKIFVLTFFIIAKSDFTTELTPIMILLYFPISDKIHRPKKKRCNSMLFPEADYLAFIKIYIDIYIYKSTLTSNGESKSFNIECFVSFSERLACSVGIFQSIPRESSKIEMPPSASG